LCRAKIVVKAHITAKDRVDFFGTGNETSVADGALVFVLGFLLVQCKRVLESTIVVLESSTERQAKIGVLAFVKSTNHWIRNIDAANGWTSHGAESWLGLGNIKYRLAFCLWVESSGISIARTSVLAIVGSTSYRIQEKRTGYEIADFGTGRGVGVGLANGNTSRRIIDDLFTVKKTSTNAFAKPVIGTTATTDNELIRRSAR
jgi:hypothetical protein